MEEKRILTITKTDGSKEQVEEVISFEFNDTKKRYVVYTKNEKDENDNYKDTILSNIAVFEKGKYVKDLDKETVSWALNFDDRFLEPTVLPAKFPNLLVNGANGIFLILSLFVKSIYIQYIDANIKDKNIRYIE